MDHSSPDTNPSPKVTYLFLTVSTSNPPLFLRLTGHYEEPLFNPPGVHCKSIRSVFLALRPAFSSHLTPAYLSDWNPDVRVLHEFSFLFALTKALDVRNPINAERATIQCEALSSRCARYVRYEGAMTVIGINIVGLMMFLRCARSGRHTLTPNADCASGLGRCMASTGLLSLPLHRYSLLSSQSMPGCSPTVPVSIKVNSIQSESADIAPV